MRIGWQTTNYADINDIKQRVQINELSLFVVKINSDI